MTDDQGQAGCSRCLGAGEVWVHAGAEAVSTPCPDCGDVPPEDQEVPVSTQERTP